MSQETFTFLLYEDTPATPYFELDVLEDEDAARRRALHLLNESKDVVAVEVSGARGVSFTVERPSAAAPFAPAPRRARPLGSTRRRPSTPWG